MHRTGGSSLRRKGLESAASVFGISPDTEAESGQSKPYLSLCYCLAASTTTKRALFWTVQQDQQIQDGKKEGSVAAREREPETVAQHDERPLKELPSPTLSDVWSNLGFYYCKGPFHWP